MAYLLSNAVCGHVKQDSKSKFRLHKSGADHNHQFPSFLVAQSHLYYHALNDLFCIVDSMTVWKAKRLIIIITVIHKIPHIMPLILVVTDPA
jgi:hypothetical protein